MRAERLALRSRAAHRTYALPELVARRLETPKGTFRSGIDALDTRRAEDPVDLYATSEAAERLIKWGGATPSAEGVLHLHVLAPDLVVRTLSLREQLVLAWCDLTDRADTAADLAVERLWPGSVGVPRLADVVRDEPAVPYSALRGFTDWLQRHPRLTAEAIGKLPDSSGDAALDSLFAAIAETAADDTGIERPEWTTQIPAAPTAHRNDRRSSGPVRGDVPKAFEARGIQVSRDTFWHVR